MNRIHSWEILIAFLKIDCYHLLEHGVAVLVVSKVDMVGCGWCWSMLIGNGIMLIKSMVDTSREEW